MLQFARPYKKTHEMFHAKKQSKLKLYNPLILIGFHGFGLSLSVKQFTRTHSKPSITADLL